MNKFLSPKFTCYEDHFIMMLWERHLKESGIADEQLHIELTKLADALAVIRSESSHSCLSFSEYGLLINVGLMLEEQSQKSHYITIEKIKNLLKHRSSK